MDNEKLVNEENISLTELIDVKILQKMQDSFSAMARMAALTTDENGVPVTVGSNFTEFCTEFCRKSPIGRARCEQCDKMGAVRVMQTQTPVSYYCHANLVDFAAPIMLGNRMIGSFIGGQVLSEPPDIERIREIAHEIEVDEDAFVEAAKKTQIVPQSAIDRSTKFIFDFANILSAMAYKEFRARELSREAMQAATQKSDFLANMSHEIRTPMNAVLGMAELALREEMSPQAQQYVRQIRSSGKNLLVIINDILDFSKIESGKMNIVEVVYEPLSIINDLANIVNNRIGSKDLEFTVDLSPDIPHKLFGDNIRIHQILLNLLNNAIKFTKKGCVSLKMYTEPLNENTVLLKAEVSDTGMGIKKEDMDKLFHSFQQVDSKRNRNVEGTGLGLAITQQLLELMRGNVSVESVYEQGSTFFIELPQKIISSSPISETNDEKISVAMMIQNDYVRHQVKHDLDRKSITYMDLGKGGSLSDIREGFLIIDRALFDGSLKTFVTENTDIKCLVIEPYYAPNDIDLPNVRILRKPVYSVTLYSALGLAGEISVNGNEADNFAFTAPDARVLIVDDNPINLVVASGILEPLKMQIDTANGATETIQKVKSVKYDIIFMDHMMPEVDGIETTHIVRRMIEGYDDVPIIALTANAVGGTREMFLSEGMNDFVAKPIETKEIVAMVKKWLPAEKIIPISVQASVASEKKEAIHIDGLNTEKAIQLLGSEKLFMQVLREYYLSVGSRAKALTRMLQENDISSYTINVHSLKSTSRQIGAEELGELAAALEQAGKANDCSFIQANHDRLVELCGKVQEILRGVFPDEAVGEQPANTADTETTLALLDELNAALECFDTLAIDEIIEKMSAYKFEGYAEDLFEKLRAAAEECDIDACTEIAENWKSAL